MSFLKNNYHFLRLLKLLKKKKASVNHLKNNLVIDFPIKNTLKKHKRKVKVWTNHKLNNRFQKAVLNQNKTLSLILNSLTSSTPQIKAYCQMEFPFVMKNFKTLMIFLRKISILILIETLNSKDKKSRVNKILCIIMCFRTTIHSKNMVKISKITHSHGYPKTLRNP